MSISAYVDGTRFAIFTYLSVNCSVITNRLYEIASLTPFSCRLTRSYCCFIVISMHQSCFENETGCEWSQICSPSSTQSWGNEIATSLHTVAGILVMSPSPSSVFPVFFFPLIFFLAQPYYKPLIPTFCLHKISQSTFSSLSSSHHLYRTFWVHFI